VTGTFVNLLGTIDKPVQPVVDAGGERNYLLGYGVQLLPQRHEHVLGKVNSQAHLVTGNFGDLDTNPLVDYNSLAFTAIERFHFDLLRNATRTGSTERREFVREIRKWRAAWENGRLPVLVWDNRFAPRSA